MLGRLLGYQFVSVASDVLSQLPVGQNLGLVHLEVADGVFNLTRMTLKSSAGGWRSGLDHSSCCCSSFFILLLLALVLRGEEYKCVHIRLSQVQLVGKVKGYFLHTGVFGYFGVEIGQTIVLESISTWVGLVHGSFLSRIFGGWWRSG